MSAAVGESTFLCLEGCVPVGGRGFGGQGTAAAAFSLSHQISQLEADCLNIMSKPVGDKVGKH